MGVMVVIQSLIPAVVCPIRCTCLRVRAVQRVMHRGVRRSVAQLSSDVPRDLKFKAAVPYSPCLAIAGQHGPLFQIKSADENGPRFAW
jgi:hypothetical protein